MTMHCINPYFTY